MPVKRVGKGISLAKLENAQKKGLILAGKLIAQRATALAPIDTGRLKRSITHGQPEKLGPGRFRIDIGTNVEYAFEVEFGTGDKSIRPQFSKNPAFPGRRAQPYLTPALKQSREDIARIIAMQIVRALKQ